MGEYESCMPSTSVLPFCQIRGKSHQDRSAVVGKPSACLRLQQQSRGMRPRSQLLATDSSSKATSNLFAYFVVLTCLVSSFPTVAEELVCPEPCHCSRPSTQLPPPIALPSIDCSHQSLDNLIELAQSLTDFGSRGENESSTSSDRHVLDASNTSLNIVQLAATSDDGNETRNILAINMIDLSHNAISSLIGIDNKSCILKSVFIVDLSYNWVESLDDLLWPLCPGFSLLREMNVSHNAINMLERTSLSSFVRLTSLDLSFNRLQSLSGSSLAGLTSLQHLFLKSNSLTRITDVFPHLPYLSVLDLSYNDLDNLPRNVFSNLNSLRELNLANNKITYLEANVFASLSNLIAISLDRNFLSVIDEPLFQNTTLQRLRLSSMPQLSNISHNIFSGLTHLTYLNMSNNHRLQFLQPNILSPMISLQTLDLSNNGFSQISSTTFLNPTLHQVYLGGLPLSCVCTNAWLTKESLKNGSVFSDIKSSRCINEKNQTLALSEADFNCGAVEIDNATTGRVDVPLGSKLMLQCQQVSDELSVLTWTTPSGHKFYHHDFHPNALLHLLSPEEVQPDAPFHKDHYWHQSTAYHDEISSNSDRIIILTDGSLYIDYMLRTDTGNYTCQVTNSFFNHSITVKLFLENEIGRRIKYVALVVGFLCALAFFTLNVVYIIITWIARRLVNKRRREIILQMLESLNSYKSVQVGRIHENYIHQLSRVRNQYHIQRDKLHSNYTGQVTKVKKGCSNQVERVRDNYHSKLTALREYSSRQVVQIRDGANNQIGRIRDYGSLQLERLRETYKLQQQHVLKLLDTMNLDNCRSVVETECMRTESMMFDIDLFENDDRMDTPTSHESEYNTATSSPETSDRYMSDREQYGDMQQHGIYNGSSSDDYESDHKNIKIEMNTNVPLAGGMCVDTKEVWNYARENDDKVSDHVLYTNVHDMDEDWYPPPPRQKHKKTKKQHNQQISQLAPLPLYTVSVDYDKPDEKTEADNLPQSETQNDETWSADYATPEASPTKVWPPRETPVEVRVDLDLEDVSNDNVRSHEESEL